MQPSKVADFYGTVLVSGLGFFSNINTANIAEVVDQWAIIG